MVNILPSGIVLSHFPLGIEHFETNVFSVLELLEASFFCDPFVVEGILCMSMNIRVATLEDGELIAIFLVLILLGNGTQLVAQTLVLGPDIFCLAESPSQR